MRLNQWFESNKTARSEFARALGVSRFTIWRYETGDRFPRPHYLARIAELTKGKVTAKDFVEQSQEKQSSES